MTAFLFGCAVGVAVMTIVAVYIVAKGERRRAQTVAEANYQAARARKLKNMEERP